MPRPAILLATFVLCSLLVSGCAAVRVGPVRLPQEREKPVADAPAVRIMHVADRRGAFDGRGVVDIVDDVHDPEEVATRAYGRVGDANVVLQRATTVVQLAEQILARAFRWSGYRVLAPGDPGYASAVPVEAELSAFWGEHESHGSYFSYTGNHFRFEIAMRVQGMLPGLRSGPFIRGRATRRSSSSQPRKMANALLSAVEVFEDDLRGRLHRPPIDVAPQALRSTVPLAGLQLVLVAAPARGFGRLGVMLRQADTGAASPLDGCREITLRADDRWRREFPRNVGIDGGYACPGLQLELAAPVADAQGQRVPAQVLRGQTGVRDMLEH